MSEMPEYVLKELANKAVGEMVAALEQKARELDAAYEEIETLHQAVAYWVIEFAGSHPRIEGAVNYACIRDVDDPTKQGFMDWTDDIKDAIQFARKVDAERFSWVYWFAQREDIRICEHQDVTARFRPRHMANMGDEGADV